MFQSRLSANVRSITPEIAVIEVRGEINLYSENVLTDAFTESTRGETQALILNFCALEYMNSAGIGLLVTMLMRANRKRQRLVACCMNQHYREIFNITHLDEAIKIYPDEAEAIAAESATAEAAARNLPAENMTVIGEN